MTNLKQSRTMERFQEIFGSTGNGKTTLEVMGENSIKTYGKGEYVERDSLIVLDDAPSFVKFMTTWRKFGYSLYFFHETAISSPRWKDIVPQTQIFCVFPSAIDLVLNHILKFVTRNGGKSYLSRQQLWLTNLVGTISRKSGYSSFCRDKRPHILWEARYRSQVEIPTISFVI